MLTLYDRMGTISTLLLLAAALAFPRQLHADDLVTIAPDFVLSKTTIAEGAAGVIAFDITMGPGVIWDVLAVNPPVFVFGDPGDFPIPGSATLNCAAEGPQSCSIAFVLDTPPADSGEPIDRGVWNISGYVEYHTTTDPTQMTVTSNPVLVVVYDTPEPTSFLLFGTGLATLTGFFRRA